MAEKIITGAVTKEYEEGWERIFGQRKDKQKSLDWMEGERKIRDNAMHHVYRRGIGSDDK